jgi:hypothetical protein
MPATGWDSRFDQVTGTLNLPAGHRLIAALGADERAALVVGALGPVECLRRAADRGLRVLDGGSCPRHRRARAAAHLPGSAEFIWLWGNLLAALAVARAAPDGRFPEDSRAPIARRASWSRASRCCRSSGCRSGTRCTRSWRRTTPGYELWRAERAYARCCRRGMQPRRRRGARRDGNGRASHCTSAATAA